MCARLSVKRNGESKLGVLVGRDRFKLLQRTTTSCSEFGSIWMNVNRVYGRAYINMRLNEWLAFRGAQKWANKNCDILFHVLWDLLTSKEKTYLHGEPMRA
jgi:hypothetical protein